MNANRGRYLDSSILDTRIRIQLLFEEWDLYRSPKMVLRDILDSWPEKVDNQKEGALQLLKEVYDFYMGPHASGSFTCNCNKVKQCGPCEMRVKVKSFLSDIRQTVSKRIERKNT